MIQPSDAISCVTMAWMMPFEFRQHRVPKGPDLIAVGERSDTHGVPGEEIPRPWKGHILAEIRPLQGHTDGTGSIPWVSLRSPTAIK